MTKYQTKYQKFIKNNYSKVTHLSNNRRVKTLKILWRESKLQRGGGVMIY